MGNCDRLKWNRRQMGLTQKELAIKADLSPATIGRLEQDESRWEIITDETFDKISGIFEDNRGMKFIRMHESVSNEIKENTQENVDGTEVIIEETNVEKLNVEVKEKKADDNNDVTIFTLLEFAFEGLKEAESHEDFVANLKLLKRIINSY